jgi:hypothetical protein
MSGGLGGYHEGNYCGLCGGINLKRYSLPKICTNLYYVHPTYKSDMIKFTQRSI